MLVAGWLKLAVQGWRPSPTSHSFTLPSQLPVTRRQLLPGPPAPLLDPLPLLLPVTKTHDTASPAACQLPSCRPVSAE